MHIFSRASNTSVLNKPLLLIRPVAETSLSTTSLDVKEAFYFSLFVSIAVFVFFAKNPMKTEHVLKTFILFIIEVIVESTECAI